MLNTITIKELHIHLDGVDCVHEQLAAIEANLKELIMTTKEEILAAVATETQEVLDKINADRAEIDAAKADIAAKAEQIIALQAKIDELTAAGGATPADLEEIKLAVQGIFTPAV